MPKYLVIAAVVTAFAIVVWSRPTLPATHGYAQPAPAATQARAADRLMEQAAAEEARAAAARRLARHDRPNAFGPTFVR